MEIIVLWFALNVGFFPEGTVYEDPQYKNAENCFNTEICIEMQFLNNHFFTGANTDFYLHPDKEIKKSFLPRSITSEIYAGIRFKDGLIEIKYTFYSRHLMKWVNSEPDFKRSKYFDCISITFQGELLNVKKD